MTTPCRGKATLFDSVEATDHEAAKALCVTCPMLTGCLILTARERDRVSRDYRPGITGTWAGQLFGGRDAA